MLLASEVEDNDRNNAEYNKCHDSTNIRLTVAALQILNMNRNRFIQILIKNQVRQQIVIPYPHGLQNSDLNKGGFHYGQNNTEEGSNRTCAVNAG